MSTQGRKQEEPTSDAQVSVLSESTTPPASLSVGAAVPLELEPAGRAPEEPAEDPPAEPLALAEGEIAIDKASSDFFIALGQEGIHSFVMLGIMQNNKPKILARVGKTNAVDKDFGAGCKMAIKGLFSQTEAELRKESLHPYAKISYAAYTISYNQYLQFTTLMALIHRKESDGKKSNAIQCHLPVREVGTTTILQLTDIAQRDEFGPENTERERRIVAATHNIKIANTCRHTAIELIEYVLGVNKLRNNIPRFFFWGLPLTTTFTAGEPADPFYVFPLPPAAYKVGKEKTALLNRIYTRMEALVTKAPYEKNTRDKFTALKELYAQQAGIAPDDIADSITSIQRWKATHREVIIQLRQQSFLGKLFTRRSSTEAMADEIEKELTARQKI